MAETGEFTEGTLVFVWNADGGWQQAFMDSLHKAVSPRTYSCRLCQLTHGLAGPRAEWSKFLKAYENEVLIYHRGQFRKSSIGENLQGIDLPVVLIRTSGKWQILMSEAEIRQFQDLEGFLQELRQRTN